MPISLLTGPRNSGRAGRIIDRVLGALHREPLLVVPTADDAARFERELCADGGAVIGVGIRTFEWLVEDVAAALGLRVAPRLSPNERLALVRAAIDSCELSVLRRSAASAGFSVALDRLLAELGEATVAPGELAERAAADGAGYERELDQLHAAYLALRERSGRSDAASMAAAAISALRARPEDWGRRPVFVYGFDDLSRIQLELLEALGRTTEVTIAVAYEDREAMAARAGLLGTLVHELGASVAEELSADRPGAGGPVLSHLDRRLFEPVSERIEPDDSLVLLECAGRRGEAEALGAEIGRLMAAGAEPDEIAVVVRDPAREGPLLADVLADLAIPVAVEASVPLARTTVGQGLLSLCRAASPRGAPEDLLRHLRADPAVPHGVADWLERRIGRGEAATVAEATAGWARPPRHLRALLAARDGHEQLEALSSTAGELAEGAHRRAAALAGEAPEGVPLDPVELRAGGHAADLLAELSGLSGAAGLGEPDLDDAAEALEAAEVPLWQGPTQDRVRVLSPYRVRIARVRFLFCAGLQDGEFPARTPADPLLGEERRRALGIGDLLRSEPAQEERFLFHACVARPRERLYLSWRACDEDGLELARSPFVDEVLDHLGPDPEAAESALLVSRGLDEVTPQPALATTERHLARALAVRAPEGASPARALEPLRLADSARRRLEALLESIPPRPLPGPLHADGVLAELRSRDVLSPRALEQWVECPYRWFVDHELEPQRLEPDADPLLLGRMAHRALERLYADPPGADSIPRRHDLGRWRRRLGELLSECAQEEGAPDPEPGSRIALARLRAQLEAFLAEEAEAQTDLRPRPELLEARFGFGEDGSSGPPLQLGELRLHGAIDRIDVAPDGRTALVRDYKTGRSVPQASNFESKGALQAQLYMLAARECLDLDPVGAVYQPLGAGRPRDRWARGMFLGDSRSLEGLALAHRGRDAMSREELEAELERAAETAREAATAMRAGQIGRRPLGGSCPSHCRYQPICRLERAPAAGGPEAEA